MKLSLFCLLLLCISPALFFPTEEESDVSSLVEKQTETTVAVAVEVEKIKSTDSDEHDDSDEEEETSEPTTLKSTKNKHNKHHKRPNKRVRDRYNQLKNTGKRTTGFRRRPVNEKKGGRKTKNKSAIEYEPRSSQTDKLNTAIDDMLLHFSQTLKNANSTFIWRLGRIPSKLKIKPWGYVVVTETKSPSKIDTKLRFERDVVNDDGLNSEEDEEENQNTTEMAIEATTSFTSSDQDTKMEDDDDEDDDENDDEPEARTDIKETRFSLKPWPVTLPDGTVEYNFQLLGENDLKLEDNNSTDVDESRSTKKSKNRDSRRRGYSPRRYPRRILARTEGIENIARSEDTLIGYRGNSTTRYIDTKVKIGPIKFILIDSAYPLNNTRVTSPLVTARFRLIEKDGKLITAKLKREKIRPSDVIVTLLAENTEEKNLPADADRLVNYFSNEMSKMWNSGGLLNRIKRQFKQQYVCTNEKYSKNVEAKKLTQKMLLLANVSSEEEPSTSAPLVFE